VNPRLIIDLEKLRHNAEFLADLCDAHGISLTAVTKVFCADSQMMDVLAPLKIAYFGDSHLENIGSYLDGFPQRTMLLRLPTHTQARDAVELADISLNSELSTIKKLAKAASEKNKTHGIMIMVDLGDLREGIYHTNVCGILEICEYVMGEENLTLEGIGTNLTCYGSVVPSEQNMGRLAEIASIIEEKFGLSLNVVSGGNSSALNMLASGKMPAKINNLRLGESIVCGLETANGKPFQGLVQDVVVLEATIVEIAKKPSMPEGDTNINAFGEKVTYVDRGEHLRAILAVGRQDTAADGLTCLTPEVEIIGASSDHLIVDITHAPPLIVGDTLRFSLSYGAVLAGFTSGYVDRHYVNHPDEG